MEREIEISLSKCAYQNRPKRTIDIIFEPKKISISSFFEQIIKGHTYSFIHKDRKAYIRKGKQNLINGGSPVVSIDVDRHIVENTNTKELFSEVFDILKDHDIEPIFIYPTFSNLVVKNKYRYRILYVFDELLPEKEYKAIGKYLEDKIKGLLVGFYDLNDKTFEIDPKSHSALQYFNGTNQQTCIYGDKVYSKDYFLGQIKAIEEEKKSVSSIAWDERILTDLERLSWLEFAKAYANEYRLILRTEPDSFNEDGFAFVDKETYFKIPRYMKKVEDGNKRKTKLYYNTLVRRMIDPHCTPMDLLFSLKYDMDYSIDNSDNGISFERLKEIVENALSVSMEDIKDKVKLELYQSKSKTDKVLVFRREINRIKHHNTYKKELTYKLINRLYDHTKTIKENCEIINDILKEDDEVLICNSVSEATIKRWLKSHSLNKVGKVKLKLEIGTLYNQGHSLRDIEMIMKRKGYKVSKSSIQRWVNEKK